MPPSDAIQTTRPRAFCPGKLCACGLLFFAISAFLTAGAFAVDVYPGCDAPLTKSDSRAFFVDPAVGSKSNDGSAAHPWHTLEEVLNPANHLLANGPRDTGGGIVASKGPIRPGDVVYLMTGNHGSPAIAGAVNSDFVSVVAAPNQTPVLKSLTLRAASHWLFRGIKFQGTKPPTAGPYDQMVVVRSDEGAASSDNIIFVENSFSAEDSTAAWTPLDWVNLPYQTALGSGARCTAIVDNHFYNLRDGIAFSGDHTLVQNNLIEDTGNDGIDMTASNATIRGNRIWRGRHTPAELLHPDGIQGWTAPGATNRNVVVDANSIINLNPAPDNYRQGISIFDGLWDGLVVSNNLVITNHWHGIALYGVTNALVINNTVIPARPDRPSWITIHDSKQNLPSEHVVVRNNIAAQLIVTGNDVTVDHNIAQKSIMIANAGFPFLKASQGGAGNHNVVHPGIFKSFADYEPAEGKFDLRPGLTSPARKGGSEDQTPALDLDNRPRTLPPDIGAYGR